MRGRCPERDEARPGDAVGELLAGLEGHDAVAVDVQHERRHAHRRQDVAYVDLQDGIDQRPGHARACRRPQRTCPHPRFCGSVMVMLGAKISMKLVAVAPVLDHLVHLMRACRMRDHLRRKDLGRSERQDRERAVKNQRGDPLRAHSGQQHRGGAALGDAKEHGPLRARGIQDRLDVGHALLERGQLRDRVRQACARLVVDDQPRERGQAGQEPREPGSAHCRSRWEMKPGETSSRLGRRPPPGRRSRSRLARRTASAAAARQRVYGRERVETLLKGAGTASEGALSACSRWRYGIPRPDGYLKACASDRARKHLIRHQARLSQVRGAGRDKHSADASRYEDTSASRDLHQSSSTPATRSLLCDKPGFAAIPLRCWPDPRLLPRIPRRFTLA